MTDLLEQVAARATQAATHAIDEKLSVLVLSRVSVTPHCNDAQQFAERFQPCATRLSMENCRSFFAFPRQDRSCRSMPEPPKGKDEEPFHEHFLKQAAVLLHHTVTSQSFQAEGLKHVCSVPTLMLDGKSLKPHFIKVTPRASAGPPSPHTISAIFELKPPSHAHQEDFPPADILQAAEYAVALLVASERPMSLAVLSDTQRVQFVAAMRNPADAFPPYRYVYTPSLDLQTQLGLDAFHYALTHDLTPRPVTVGKHVVLRTRLLSRTTNSTVYACDIQGQRDPGVIKTLSASLPPEVQQLWFDRERAALAAVSGDPHFPHLLAADRGTFTLLITPLCARCPPRYTAEMVAEYVAGLQRLHEAGLAHMDVRPSNLMISQPNRTPLILDLGLACRLTDPAQTGDPVYLSDRLLRKKNGREPMRPLPEDDLESLLKVVSRMLPESCQHLRAHKEDPARILAYWQHYAQDHPRFQEALAVIRHLPEPEERGPLPDDYYRQVAAAIARVVAEL
ncbi:hypothetical protein PAPYR_13102 [Paratrimastix pyriformis]|uniref:Protein kinase domain-containing protein n=1 Tax=Paratrimastix pyriformis TaxID=342808 RepID=A0ABQ8U526_9EUKA|nr:hypothetical protein PAPYR_13102 [Paratrimastix pyriformis]